jgi:pre-mRNA-splicing helicase BRR2
MTSAAHLVVVMGTQSFDAAGTGSSDYPVTDLLQMLGRASRPNVDDVGKCVLMCHAPRKEYYKKFLFEPLPVESHLDHFLHDHFVAEIVTRTIENKQDAVDYLTWTFYYRRLAQNPNFYNMTGTTHRHLSDHLSDLVESTLADLERSRVIAVEDEMDLGALNLGMIAAYYYITYTTLELFAGSLAAKTKLKGMLEIVCAASEFDTVPLRPGEEDTVERLLKHAVVSAPAGVKYTDPHTKVNALLQAHFSRTPLAGDLVLDVRTIVPEAVRLLQACVDVIASSGWLSPALVAMEMSQMVSQGIWDKDSPLLQLPHVTKDLAKRCGDAGVGSVFELLDLEDDRRRELLNLPESQLADVAAVCARYPDIQLTYESTSSAGCVLPGEAVTLSVSLEREMDEDAKELSPVPSARFPGRRDEAWWLVVGDPKANTLLAIKRVVLGRASKVKLEFAAPADKGAHALTLFFMCDSWMGCDQEYELVVDVGAGGGEGAPDAMEE